MPRRPLLLLLVLAGAFLAGREDEQLPPGPRGEAPRAEPTLPGPEVRIAGQASQIAPSPPARSATAIPASPGRSAIAHSDAGERPGAGRPATSSSQPAKSVASASGYETRRAEARRFLAGLYRQYHGREGDPDVIAMWADLIAAGTLTREQAVENFLDSPQSLQLAAPLARLYLAAFQRAPDEAGWRHWRSALASGRSLDSIGEAFASSEEFAAAYGGMDDARFLDLAYRNTLERPPTAQERAEWESRLAAGLATRGAVLLSLSESPEFTRATSAAVDASLLYSGLLGRSADAAGFAAWMRTAQSDGFTRSAMITGFLDSSEYRLRSDTAPGPRR